MNPHDINPDILLFLAIIFATGSAVRCSRLLSKASEDGAVSPSIIGMSPNVHDEDQDITKNPGALHVPGNDVLSWMDIS